MSDPIGCLAMALNSGRKLYFACDVCIYFVTGFKWYGVDITKEDIADNFEACVWEPAVVKINALTGASEAAALILSVDETIKNPKSSMGDDGPLPQPRPGRKGRGRPR